MIFEREMEKFLSLPLPCPCLCEHLERSCMSCSVEKTRSMCTNKEAQAGCSGRKKPNSAFFEQCSTRSSYRKGLASSFASGQLQPLGAMGG